MIELYTGVPGAGKTAKAVHRLLELSKEYPDRPIFAHGVPALKIKNFPIRCNSPACDVCPSLPDNLPLADLWQEWAPDGAFIFIDECQNVFRPAAVGAQVPPHVSALEVHRHKGIDFLLVTQSPKLIRANVRRLVSKHIHLAGNWARRYQMEWGECSDSLSKTNAISSTYRIPKHVFPLYQSASLHTKLSMSIPWQLYIFIGALILAVFLGYRLYLSKFAPSKPLEVKPGQASAFASALSTGQNTNVNHNAQSFDFNPTVPNHPESAPAYAGVAKVTDFPRLSACIKSEKKCTCYTQQATIYAVNIDECADYVRSARFNPYRVAPAPNSVQPLPEKQVQASNNYRSDYPYSENSE